MKITQEELERRLKGNQNLLNKLSIVPSEKGTRGNDSENRNNAGRKEEIPNAPASLRVVAGILAKAENNSAAVARKLELTPGQVRYAEKTKETALTEKQVQDLALTRLMDTLGLLTIDRIEDEKPKDIASIAANLSRVHTNLKPKESGDGNSVNIMIYAPKQRSEKEYEVLEVQSA